ncbi:MAG: 5'-methylthioadenosine/adenosylhomocysteine nucleosidase [Clostridia bacterium]|nr:5'-methylthioadenosine/adenosylhomocysteine nucleosidase [Clostridia bacterium]
MNNIIGIIGAMDIEVNGLISEMSEKSSENISGIDFIRGKLYGKEIVVAKCGIGKVFASVCTQTMILKYSPEFIINSGVAGTLCDQLSVMDTIIATKVVQHDMDTSPLGDPQGLISGINVVYIDTDKNISEKIINSAKGLNINTSCGIIASGDQFIANVQRKAEIANYFGALACEMEGASVGQVCYVNKVPFAIMRTISDGKGEALDYNTFAKAAASQSIEIIKKFLNNYEV